MLPIRIEFLFPQWLAQLYILQLDCYVYLLVFLLYPPLYNQVHAKFLGKGLRRTILADLFHQLEWN